MDTPRAEARAGIAESRAGIELSTPGGWRGKIWGEKGLLIVLLIIAAGVVGYLLYQHDVESKKANERIERAILESNEIQQAVLWVNSLSDNERAKLNLTRPRKIAEMQR